MKKTKEQKGITLISLVSTIIILLILATVAITLAVDSDGLFSKAGTAANTWNTSVAEENTELENLMLMANSVGGTTGGETEEQITFTLGSVEITTTKGINWRQWSETVDEEELTNLGVDSFFISMIKESCWESPDNTGVIGVNVGPPIGSFSLYSTTTSQQVRITDEIIDGDTYYDG